MENKFIKTYDNVLTKNQCQHLIDKFEDSKQHWEKNEFKDQGKSFDDKDIKNVFSSKDRLISYVKFEDEDFIKTAYSNPTNLRKFLKKFNELNKNENCIQNFTADIILPYLLKKPSCTKYFSSWLALSKKAQLKYIATLKVKSPKYIIYESPGFIVDKIPTHERLILVNSYIIDNYRIYETFNDYSILIKK